MSIDAGDLATWVGAVGTTGALLVSLYLLRDQQQAQRRAEDTDLISEARLVSLWAEKAPEDAVDVVVRNSNAGPIYDVIVLIGKSSSSHVTIRSADGRSINRVEAVSASDADGAETDSAERDERGVEVGTVPPSADRRFKICSPAGEPSVPLDSLRLSIIFTDSVGLRWKRSSSGFIEEAGFALTLAELQAHLDLIIGPEVSR